MRKTNCFTVIEVLVSIGIMMTLLGFVVLRFEGSRKLGRDSLRLKDVQNIQNGLERYYLKNGNYPETLDDLKAADFINEVPQDPTGGETYLYSYCKTGSEYAIMAKLESRNMSLENDVDKDWPSVDNCNCDGVAGDNEQEQNIAPFTFCVKNP
jgi:type II secretory pathway pseudopilin PulG